MNSTRRRDHYLAKAQEAEIQAARASDAHAQSSREYIAACYRELACQQMINRAAGPSR